MAGADGPSHFHGRCLAPPHANLDTDVCRKNRSKTPRTGAHYKATTADSTADDLAVNRRRMRAEL